MRRLLVAGNWKMHGSRAENAALLDAFLRAEPPAGDAEVLVCPPFVYLHELARQLRENDVALGAQDVCAEPVGAHTGEVSAAMLRDVGCTYVIVGHSERRALYGEDDQLVARKFVAAQRERLVPILCVGETLDERESGRTAEVVLRQLDAVLELAGVEGFRDAVLAYEPVWAIGTGKNATSAQAQEVHALLRARIAAKDANMAACLRILYGGSVKAANAAELFAMPDVDGGLVGGASLNGEEFRRICGAAGKQET
ncbi:MAG: triosephosphate isomerase [Proteobacteria bacterium]|nr:triosephosphate isomerase [Pseudomonadota bacterium]